MRKATRETYSPAPVSRAKHFCKLHVLRRLKQHVRILSILGILSTFTILTLSAQTQTDQPTGASELKKGNYENAIRLLNTQLASNPNDAEAETNLLYAFIETGRYTDAETSAKKFLVKDP